MQIEAFEAPSAEQSRLEDSAMMSQPGQSAPAPPPGGSVPTDVQNVGQPVQSAQDAEKTPEITPMSVDAPPPVLAPPAPQGESAGSDATPISAPPPPAPMDDSSTVITAPPQPSQSDEQANGAEKPSGGEVDLPTSNQTAVVLKWLIARDSTPESFEMRFKKTYKAHFNGDMIVDDESTAEYATVTL